MQKNVVRRMFSRVGVALTPCQSPPSNGIVRAADIQETHAGECAPTCLTAHATESGEFVLSYLVIAPSHGKHQLSACWCEVPSSRVLGAVHASVSVLSQSGLRCFQLGLKHDLVGAKPAVGTCEDSGV